MEISWCMESRQDSLWAEIDVTAYLITCSSSGCVKARMFFFSDILFLYVLIYYYFFLPGTPIYSPRHHHALHSHFLPSHRHPRLALAGKAPPGRARVADLGGPRAAPSAGPLLGTPARTGALRPAGLARARVLPA